MFRYIILLSLFFRSIGSADAADSVARQQYIDLWKNEAIYQMAVHKIPASITLAQGILESGDGKSRLATEGNNHFGIKCHEDWKGGKIYEDDETKGECFRRYVTAHDSYEDHATFLARRRYEPLFLLDPDDYKGWAKGLKECGYATNPKYPQLLIGIIEDFNLDQYDKIGNEYIRKNKVPARSENTNTPSTILSEHTGTKPGVKKRRGHHNESEDRTDITISHRHKVHVSENNIKYVIAQAGDTQESIGLDFDLNAWIIRKFNDLNAGETIHEGDIIYLQPKRNKGTEDNYTVKSGDTVRKISQKFGIKQRKLCKLNHIQTEDKLAPGTFLKLKK